jgi:hypothetical protein
VNFGFGDVLKVMSGLHPDVDAGIVEARLKYLQRLPFPSSDIKVGKGARAYYTAEQLAKLTMAFELLAVGVVPTQAASIVDGLWSELSPSFAAAWLERDQAKERRMLVVRVRGFDARRGATGTVVETTMDDAVGNLKSLREDDDDDRDTQDRRAIVLDLSAAVEDLASALSPGTTVYFEMFGEMKRFANRWKADRKMDEGSRTAGKASGA